MRIGIIGSGISGPSAAWGLAAKHEVTVFESNAQAGGHAWTVDVDGEAVDLGFMVFNTVTYPELCRLFDHLGVTSRWQFRLQWLTILQESFLRVGFDSFQILELGFFLSYLF